MGIVVTTGGRRVNDRELVSHSLRCLLHYELLDEGDLLVQGGARGADQLVKEEGMRLGLQVVTFHANWQHHGRMAGPQRNRRMIELKPKFLIAYPGQSGTRGCVREAMDAGIDICSANSTQDIKIHGPDGVRKKHRLHVLPKAATART